MAGVGAAALRVHRSLLPPPAVDPGVDFAAMRVVLEEVRFVSADGIDLAGWLLAGRPDREPIVLCHDFGRDKGSMLDLGLALQAEGFPVLAFDFRGHGASGPARSTRGLDEKRDVLGAIDFLAGRPEHAGRRLGVYGAGMGAHAAVLAAGERRNVRVLVLDGLYPDVGFALQRELYAGLKPRHGGLELLTESLFLLVRGRRADSERAADVLARLLGRDVLLLASPSDTRLAAEIEAMYRSIPEQRDADGNLVHLPATESAGLYGEARERHRSTVESFFLARLGG